MPTTVEILLRSTFDSSGYDAAQEKTKEIAAQLEGELFTGEEAAALPALSFPTAEGAAFAEEMQEVAEGLRSAARNAEALGDHKLSKQFTDEASKAQQLAERYKKLGSITESELIKKHLKAGQTLDELAKDLEKTSKESKKLQASLTLLGKTAAAEVFERSGNAADRAARKIKNLEKAISDVGDEVEESQFAELFQDTGSVDDFKKRLKEAHKELEATRDAAIEAGEETGTIAAADKIQDLEAFDKKIFGMQGSFQHLGQEAKGLGKVLTHPFNQLGFALFVTTSTLRNITGIAKQLFEVFEQGARQIEKLNAVTIAAKRVGSSLEIVTDELEASSKGYIKQNELLTEYIRLTNAQNRELSANAAFIVDAAIAYSKLVGDTTTAPAILQEITGALIDGNAAVIDSTLGYLKLTDAESRMVRESERLGYALSDLEKQQIVFDVFVEQAGDVIDATEDMAGGADNITRFKESASKDFRDLTADVTFLIDEIAGLTLATQELKDETEEEADNLLVDSIIRAVPGLKTFLDSLHDTTEGIEEAGGTWQYLGDEADNLREKWGFLLRALPGGSLLLAGLSELEFLGDAAQETADKVAAAAEQMQDPLPPRPFEAFDFSQITEQFDWILGAERQFYIQRDQLADDAQESMSDLTDDHNERLLKMEQDKDDKIETQFEKTQERREKLTEDHNERLLDIEEGYNDKILDIDDDLALRESRTIEDANTKQTDKAEKHNKKLEDIEENHQKKLRDIMRKFELSRLRALIDRDARALFEAQQKRDSDLAKAHEDADEKRDDENESFKETIDDLEDNLEKRLRRLREDAQRRRDDAKDQFEDQRQDELDRYIQQDKDLKDAFKKQRKTIEDAWKKKRKETIKQYDKQRKEIKDKYKEQKIDLENAYDEQNLITETQAAQATFIRFTELTQQATDLQTQLDLEKDIWAEYWNWVNTRGKGEYSQPPGSTPGPGPTPGPAPGPAPPPSNVHCDKNIVDVPNSSNISPGGDCNPQDWDDQGVRPRKGGTIFSCVPTPLGGGRWRVVNDDCSIQGGVGGAAVLNTSPPPMVAPSPGSTPLTSSLFSSNEQFVGGGGNGRIPVHLVVDNDETLKEILKSISYEAFIEITE